MKHILVFPSAARWVLARAALLLATTHAVLAAPAIPNASFEANAAFPTSPGTVALNAPITGWTVNDTTRAGLNPAGGLNFHADNGKVPHGTRVAFLNSVSNNTASMSTTITGLTAGAHYRVQFRYNCKNTAPGKPTTTFRINGTVTGIIHNPPSVESPGSHTLAYHTHNLLFVATGPTAALEISNTTNLDSTLLVDHFVVTQAAARTVTNVNSDGPGSLRQTLAACAATPGFEVILFAPALSGQTIELMEPLVLQDIGGVAVDGTALPKGITVANASGQTSGLMDCFSTTRFHHFRGLTFSGGGSTGGAIDNNGNMQFTRCTFTGNGQGNTSNGGAVNNIHFCTLVQCTLAGNSATNSGGAIFNASGARLHVDQCTVSGNSAPFGAGGIFSNGILTLTNSIVSGNTSTNAPTFADIVNAGGNAHITRLGANVVDNYVNSGGTDTGGNPAIDAAPGLAALADNGGATKTMAVQFGSPARNASVASVYATDQRTRAVQGSAHDIGAYDVQKGRFVMPAFNLAVAETAGNVGTSAERVDGFEGSVTVNLTAVPGTAGPSDYGAITPPQLTFNDGISTQSFTIAIVNDNPLAEANETFTIALRNPSPGTSIGTPSALFVAIVDTPSAPDAVPPRVPTILTPATVPLNVVNNQITFTGTASDNKVVSGVTATMTLDGGSPIIVSGLLSPFQAAAVTWTASIVPGTAANTLKLDVTATDGAALTSPAATRTFTLQYPLRVRLNGNGSVTAGFAPLSFRRVGNSHTITATPAPGHIFAGWSVVNATATQIGVPAVALERPTLTFLFRHNMELVANFEPSPFTPLLVGNYNGLITPQGLTPSRNSTEGLMAFTLQASGAFSGTVQIDGGTHVFSGAMDHNGVARFGTGRAFMQRIARRGKPSYQLEFNLVPSAGILTDTVAGELRAMSFSNDVVSESAVGGRRAQFSATNQIPTGPLISAGKIEQAFNIIFRPVVFTSQPPGVLAHHYPQGTGIGRVILSKTGRVTLVGCTLADGTTGVTATTFLNQANRAALFVPLYGRTGFLRTELVFDTGAATTDLTGDTPKWSRPVIPTSHYYRQGWPDSINVTILGTKYNVTPGLSSVLPVNGAPLQAPDASGNCGILFENGQLTQVLSKAFNASATDVVTKMPANDGTYTLAITRSTGLFSGTFLHTDATIVGFKGILLQKPANSGGFGFFLTKQPVPIDFSGESGDLTLFGTP